MPNVPLVVKDGNTTTVGMYDLVAISALMAGLGRYCPTVSLWLRVAFQQHLEFGYMGFGRSPFAQLSGGHGHQLGRSFIHCA